MTDQPVVVLLPDPTVVLETEQYVIVVRPVGNLSENFSLVLRDDTIIVQIDHAAGPTVAVPLNLFIDRLDVAQIATGQITQTERADIALA